jgi:hypothetical protein
MRYTPAASAAVREEYTRYTPAVVQEEDSVREEYTRYPLAAVQEEDWRFQWPAHTRPQ